MWAGWTIQGWKADSEKLEVCRTDLTKAAGEMAALQSNIYAAQKKAKEASDAYQNRLSYVNSELDRVKRLPARCVCPLPRPSAPKRCDGTTSATGELYQADGVTSDTLYDFAGDAERVRQQLLACQAWVAEGNH